VVCEEASQAGLDPAVESTRMSLIAIIGSGPIGGALAHKLAGRNRVREVRLIDPDERIAQGKALDIRQSAPLEGFSTHVTAAGSVAAAAGADAIVLADHANGAGEHTGDAGLALLRQVAAVESSAPIVCAGATQRDLIVRGVTELHLTPSRIVGSAPLALESALRALAGLVIDVSGVEISVHVVGVPPRSAVAAWEEASAFGQPLTSHVLPHTIAALTARIPGLWPPGPYALASAASRVAEALALGSRRRFSCFVTVARGRVAAMPVELGQDGVLRVIEPALTRQERTMLENAIS
jgi:malate dehydrogenase